MVSAAQLIRPWRGVARSEMTLADAGREADEGQQQAGTGHRIGQGEVMILPAIGHATLGKHQEEPDGSRGCECESRHHRGRYRSGGREGDEQGDIDEMAGSREHQDLAPTLQAPGQHFVPQFALNGFKIAVRRILNG
jgi:hypothetical protein